VKGIIATICFTVLTLVGCVADRPDPATHDQDESASVEQAVSSTLAHEVVPGVEVLTAPFHQLTSGGTTPQAQIICVSEGDCASCCSSTRCCSACGSGPVSCTGK